MAIVTLPQLKAHLKIDEPDEDAFLTELLEQAQAAAESFCKRAFDNTAPADVRLAILLYASHFYEIRDNYDKQAWISVSMAWKSLLWPYRDTTKLF